MFFLLTNSWMRVPFLPEVKSSKDNYEYSRCWYFVEYLSPWGEMLRTRSGIRVPSCVSRTWPLSESGVDPASAAPIQIQHKIQWWHWKFERTVKKRFGCDSPTESATVLVPVIRWLSLSSSKLRNAWRWRVNLSSQIRYGSRRSRQTAKLPEDCIRFCHCGAALVFEMLMLSRGRLDSSKFILSRVRSRKTEVEASLTRARSAACAESLRRKHVRVLVLNPGL